MNKKIEEFLRTLMSARGLLGLYAESHSEFKATFDKAYMIILDILNELDDLTIGIIGDEFVYKTELFEKLSIHLKETIAFLKGIGIERLSFYPGLEKAELLAFLKFILPGREDDAEAMVSYFTDHRIRNITAGKIKTGISSDGPADETSFTQKIPASLEEVYDLSLEVVTQSIEKVLSFKTLDSRNLKTTITSVMTNLLGAHQEFLKLSTVKRYDIITFMHILKVSILAMHFSSRLGFDREDIMEIGLAALFHDIGKIYISRKIIKKPDALTKDEFQMVANHTQIGAEIMLNYVDSLGILPVIVAYEHHVKYDGKGYPRLAPHHKPHIVSRITALCDVYDALSERRSYKDNFAPDMVYSIMKKGRGEHFDPLLFDKFFEAVGVWPIGSIIELTDGRIALVRDVNSEAIESPIVQPIKSDERIDLSKTTKTLVIKRCLNPRLDGAQYLQYL
jgi:putative nucleotidyltransferase with HDIG domain